MAIELQTAQRHQFSSKRGVKLVRMWVALATTLFTIAHPSSASAQASPSTVTISCFFKNYPQKSYYTTPFEATPQEITISIDEFRVLMFKMNPEIDKSTILSWSSCEQSTRQPWPGITVDWLPSFAKPVSAVQSYNISYKDGGQAGHGYDNASIKLKYRFLLCADEIQVVYGIDRKSLKHSDRYVVKPAGGGNLEYANPASEPSAPATVPLNLRVTLKTQSAITTIGHLRDQTAGETLGMGCFTGQTQKIGFVKTLVGPQGTKPQIKAFLDSLILANASGTGTAPDLDFPLTNADYPAPPPPTKRAVPAPQKKRT